MRLAFMGTPEFSVPFLQALHKAGHEIAAVYTRPPRASGRRGLSEIASPVHQAAEALGLPVYTPKTLRDSSEQARLQALGLDAAIIVAYGLILPEAVLSAPRLGCYNAHASLLPRWRGAAPVQRAIAAGDKETGIVIMRMDKGLDTGPVVCAGKAPAAQTAFIHRLPIGADMTAGQAFAALSQAGAELMVAAAAALADGAFSLLPQPQAGATYAHKIEKDETRIDWGKSAEQVHKHICSLSPFPGAWCEMAIGGRRERVKILASHAPSAAEPAAAAQTGMVLLSPEAESAPSAPIDKADILAVQCAQGAVFLTQLQKAGGKALSVRAFLRGAAVQAVF